MEQEEFEKIFERQFNLSHEILIEKAREYASDNDRLHNFQIAAVITGGTPEQALWGFLAKHLVSLSDMVQSGNPYDGSVWDEKIGDSINYLILLRAQVFETERANSPDEAIDFRNTSLKAFSPSLTKTMSEITSISSKYNKEH